jgi:hypothetical protein
VAGRGRVCRSVAVLDTRGEKEQGERKGMGDSGVLNTAAANVSAEKGRSGRKNFGAVKGERGVCLFGARPPDARAKGLECGGEKSAVCLWRRRGKAAAEYDICTRAHTRDFWNNEGAPCGLPP